MTTLKKKTRQIRPAKGSISIDPALDLQVGAGSDDCFRKRTYPEWDLNYVYQMVGRCTATNKQVGGGMRFTGVTIPQGATIVTAYLTLRCKYYYGGTPCNTRISAENVDDAPTFINSYVAFDSRYNNRTAARVDWDDIPVWTVGTDYNSPEIKTVIQEIVDRAGWVSGNSIVIFWEDFDDRSPTDNAERLAHSYNSSPTYAPKLHIEYKGAPKGMPGLSVGARDEVMRVA